ncbi:zf-HC2 domain-containing protein [Paucibacter sp. AS339]|uniref:zf-HC2 domain-containing protein n=1 Tax=Paucibacter hankyongi TaxID=3133434 RepID=UPI0030AFC553
MSRKKVLPSCRDITQLVLQGEDRELSLGERFKMRMHLMICKACPIFVEQVALMRQASQRWRRYSETDQGS